MTTILVEGCDGSGKSTLIEHARGNQKDHYFLIARASRYQPSIKTALNYLAWIKHCPYDLVLDRLHFVSDRVYGPILRNEDVFKALPLSFGTQSMNLIIYCRPPLTTVLANLSGKKHLAGVAEQAERIYNAYDEVMAGINNLGITRVLRYNYTDDEPVSFWNYAWSEANEVKS